MKKTYITPNIKVRTIAGRETFMAASVDGTESGKVNFFTNEEIDDPARVGAKASKTILWDDEEDY